MVSNTLDIELKKFLQVIERMRRDYGNDADYKKLRRDLPDDWPM